MKNIIHQIIKEELLRERAGISEVVRQWAKIIKNIIAEEQTAHREEQSKKQPETQKPDPKDDPFYWEDEIGSTYGKKYGDYGNYGTYNYNYQTYEPLDEIIIYGDDFPEVYEKFPVDMWVLKNSSRIEYDHYNSGYEEGSYVVYLNIPLIAISESALNHEIKHAYDDWNRIKAGGKAIKDTWEINNIYTKDFEKLIIGGRGLFPQLTSVVYNYYLASKLETPAYLETDYDKGGIDYKNIGLKLKNFDIKSFLNKKGEPAKGLEMEFEGLKKYDIPLFKKFNNVFDFLNWTKKYFNKRGDDIFRRVSKMRYVHDIPDSPKYEPIKWETPKTTKIEPEKEVKKIGVTSDNDEDVEEFDGWKFDKNKGWYLDPDYDKGFDYF